jgi:hypothetical protein
MAFLRTNIRPFFDRALVLGVVTEILVVACLPSWYQQSPVRDHLRVSTNSWRASPDVESGEIFRLVI